MDANLQQTERTDKPFMDLNDPGLNGIYGSNGSNGKHSELGDDQAKEDSDEDYGPETDVDAVDDVLLSPSKNPFSSDCWQKSAKEEDSIQKLIEYSRQETVNIADDVDKDDKVDHTDVMRFSDDFGQTQKSTDVCATQTNSSNPFDESHNGNKYLVDFDLNKEQVDNFLNSNIVKKENAIHDSNPFDLPEVRSNAENVQVPSESNLDVFGQSNDDFSNQSNQDLFAFVNENLNMNKTTYLSNNDFEAPDRKEKDIEPEQKLQEDISKEVNLLDAINRLPTESMEPDLIVDSQQVMSTFYYCSLNADLIPQIQHTKLR